jgi:histidyl-tRNA synthetase
VGADAEVLAVALDALRLLGLTEKDIVARVSDRRLLEQLLVHIGVAPERMGAAYAIIDKIGRDAESQTREKLGADAGLDKNGITRVLAIFQHENLDSLAAEFGGAAAVDRELERLRSYFAQLSDLGFADFVRFDPRIVRGLAYYTGIVFEIFDRQGELRAVCGGGRYDDLLKNLGGVDLPALGFGMGDVVLAELLADRGLLADYTPRIDYYIVAVTDAERPAQKRLARRLRDAGHSVSYSFKTGSVGKQFKDAHARGARFTVVVGPDEVAKGEAVVKEMQTGEEKRVKIDEL